MIELNGCFFDEDLRYGFVPDREKKDTYIVMMQNGAKAAFEATENQIREAFCPEETEVTIILNDAQRDELMKALEAGYEWVAVDDRGIAFAFESRPTKAGAYWDAGLRIDLAPLRLTFSYSQLGADLPYSIACLLTE